MLEKMKNRKPMISVIVAVLNGAQTIQRCIDSFARQSYSEKELIIIDGQSQDGTVEILKRNNNSIAYWETDADRGICHAWNKALARSSGDWICFLGSDDFIWDDSVLESAALLLQDAYPPYKVTYGPIYTVQPDGTVLEMVGAPWNKVKRAFSQIMAIPHQGVFHHRSLFESHGYFDEDFRVAGDYELLLRELKDGNALFLDELIISAMQREGISQLWDKSLLVLEEYAKAREKNNLKNLPILWYRCFFRSYTRILAMKLIGRKLGGFGADFYRILTGKPPIWTK